MANSLLHKFLLTACWACQLTFFSRTVTCLKLIRSPLQISYTYRHTGVFKISSLIFFNKRFLRGKYLDLNLHLLNGSLSNDPICHYASAGTLYHRTL